MTEKPFTVMDLADRWGCNEDYVHELIESGKLRAFTIGGKKRRGSYRVTPDAEQLFLDPPVETSEQLEPVLKGFVYFAGYGPFLKIGFTSLKDWKRRISSIQTCSPEPITIWRVFAADSFAETMLHDVLSAYRVSGEWFSLGDEGKYAASLTCTRPSAPKEAEYLLSCCDYSSRCFQWLWNARETWGESGNTARTVQRPREHIVTSHLQTCCTLSALVPFRL